LVLGPRMRLPAPFCIAGDHIAIDLPGARAVFTTRRGGFSRGRYDSLNLGLWTGDDRSAVMRNRDSLRRAIGVGFAYGRQVHGARIGLASMPSSDRLVQGDADGQATATLGIGPMVVTADCLPVAIAGDGAVVMLHAGWRGLAAGVLAAGVGALRELGARGPLSGAIGPGAGPCCYEVGEEVQSVFASEGASASAGKRPNLDLKAIARKGLERAGVADVYDCELCTICSAPGLFYSHRRDQGLTGRQAGIAWLT